MTAIYRAPETWARRAFPSLIYFNEAERGGHFPAWEEPMLLPRSSGRRSGRCAEPEVFDLGSEN
jgi:hypothetical protein